MGRRRIPDDKIRQIQQLGAKGIPQAEIAQMLDVSVGAVSKYLIKPAPPEAVDEIPEEIPEGLPVDIVEKWIRKVDRLAEAAEAAKDFGAVNGLLAKLATLKEHQRKAAPPPKADPNENPDMIAAAKRGRETLHKLVESA
jgi:transcriptional regulator with XRE-family HTH domain